MGRGDNYIEGYWKKGEGEPFYSEDPSSEELIWSGHAATADEVASAVAAAKEAQKGWEKLPIERRISTLKTFQALLEKERESLAETISKEVGKPFWESLTEVASMIAKVDISMEAYGERCPTKSAPLGSSRSTTRHRAHGALAILGPYNFPAHLPNGHIIPALLAGNSVIFKPSEKTPLVAEEITLLWERAGLPKGLFQLLQGGKETAIALSSHPSIDGLLFTGSYETGQLLRERFAAMPEKILALELGGNNPLVAFNVSDSKSAAYTALLSSFMTTGQRCTSARRLILKRGDEGDSLLEQLVAMSEKIAIGSYRERPEPFMGPLISREAKEAILAAQASLVAMGGEILLEAKALEPSPAFLSPGIVDVTAIDDPPDKEVFGPLLQVVRVETFDEAIEAANKTEYGLAAGLLGDSREEFELFRERIRAGIVNWNSQTTGASSRAPFGGLGKSGNHRPSAYYAADYCSVPVASIESERVALPKKLSPGLEKIEEMLL